MGAYVRTGKKGGCGFVLSVVTILLSVSSCHMGHPSPGNDEVYEVRDPDNGRVVVRVITRLWSDGRYTEAPVVDFRQLDGTIWKVNLPVNDPKYWEVSRIHPEKGAQKIPLVKIYSGRARGFRRTRSAFDIAVLEDSTE